MGESHPAIIRNRKTKIAHKREPTFEPKIAIRLDADHKRKRQLEGAINWHHSKKKYTL
jgi:hypothetical protein